MKKTSKIRKLFLFVLAGFFIMNFLYGGVNENEALDGDLNEIGDTDDIEKLIDDEVTGNKDESSNENNETRNLNEAKIETITDNVDDEVVLDNETLGLPSETEGEKIDEENQKISLKEETSSDEEPNLEDEFKVEDESVQPVKKGVVEKKEPTRNTALNEITNLEFKMEGNDSRIIISSKNRLQYREIKNQQMKQVIYFFENTLVPEKLQRAYDTTEFRSPVALFTLFQSPNESNPTVKLIIQLRELQEPSVVETERGLVVDFGSLQSKEALEKLEYSKEKEDFDEENLYLSGHQYTGKKINKLEVKNSDVQDVLRLIAKTSGYNIVIGDDVSGKVGTLSLENVPWDQAFALVLQAKKLGYVRQGNVLRVATLTTLRDEKTQAAANEKAKIAVEPLKTVMIPISYAKASDLAPKAKPFLTERGTVDTDDRTNTIIIKDIKKVIDQTQKLFASLDTQPPRVSVGARFVEVSSTFNRDLGTNLLRFGSNISGTNLDFGQTFQGGGWGQFTVNSSNFAALNATLNIGESEGKIKTLANPSITVVANQTGTVVQSKNFACQIAETVNGVTTVSYKMISATLNLNVKPIVAGDGTIFLDIKLNNDIPSPDATSCANLTTDGRNIETQVLIENGDTVVVGSVFKTTLSEKLNYFPFLGRIPLLGILFSSKNYKDDKSEIFVFVTAKIMNLEESFKRSL